MYEGAVYSHLYLSNSCNDKDACAYPGCGLPRELHRLRAHIKRYELEWSSDDHE
jgi:hypothetical protein